MNWLKDLLSDWRVSVALVGGAVVVMSMFGTCTYEPGLPEDGTEESEEASETSGEDVSNSNTNSTTEATTGTTEATTTNNSESTNTAE